MVETDPILIRIQCIDEATPVITKFTNQLMQLQKFKMPEFKMPELKFPEMDIKAGDIIKNINVIKAPIEQATLSAREMTDVITRDFQKGLDQMNVEPIERLDKTLVEAGISSKQFANFLAKNNLEVIKGIGVYDRLSGAILTQGQAVKLAAIQHRRFKFEWLSIMFAGMALNRTFGSLINAQMQLWGVSEGIASMWTLVMAPAMEEITPLIWDIIDAIMNLPEKTQLAIGYTIIGLDILAKGMTFTGQLMLLLGGLKYLGITFSTFEEAISYAMRGIAGGIGIYFLYQGIKDINDKPIAGMGDFLAAAGLLKYAFLGGGGWMIAIGISLKLLGDEEFTISVMKFFIKTGTYISNILAEAIKAGLSLGVYKPNLDKMGITDFVGAWKKAVEQANLEMKGLQPFGMEKIVIFPSETIKDLQKQWDDLLKEQIKATSEAGKISDENAQKIWDSYKPRLDAIKTEIDNWKNKYNTATQEVTASNKSSTTAISYSWGSYWGLQTNQIVWWANLFGFKTKNISTQVESVNKDVIHLGNTVNSIPNKTTKITSNASEVSKDIININKQLDNIPKNKTTTITLNPKINEADKSFWKKLLNWIGLKSFQHGGIMPYTGMAYLHAGEKIIPKNQVNNQKSSIIFSPSININAQVSSDYDVRKLADELNYYFAKDFERMIKGRVTI